MLGCFWSFACIAILDVFLDILAHIWPIIYSPYKCCSFCSPPMSCSLDIVVLSYDFSSDFFIFRYPYSVPCTIVVLVSIDIILRPDCVILSDLVARLSWFLGGISPCWLLLQVDRVGCPQFHVFLSFVLVLPFSSIFLLVTRSYCFKSPSRLLELAYLLIFLWVDRDCLLGGLVDIQYWCRSWRVPLSLILVCSLVSWLW